MDSLWHALGVVMGAVLMQLFRAFARTRFWKRVTRRGQRYYDDPQIPTRDTREAAELALIDEQSASVNRVARKIQNGHGG